VEPIPIPAPSSNKLVPTVVAIPTLKSASSIVVELITVSVPSTYKSPLILTIPVLSPIAEGSIISSAGPVIVLVLIPMPDPTTPPICTVDVVLLKVKLEDAPDTPSSLKITSVSLPAIGPIRPCVP
jgi:hypothetical protein